MSIKVEEKTVAAPSVTKAEPTSGESSRWVNLLAFDKIGAIYVWIAIVVVFSFWAPDTFPNITTAKQILNSNAITGLAALAVTIPLAARVFDLSFALNMTLRGVAVAHFVVDGVPLALALTIGVLDRTAGRPDQRDGRGRDEDRLVHRDPRDRLADPGPHHPGHQ